MARWRHCGQRSGPRRALGDKPSAEEQAAVLTCMVQADYLLDKPCKACDGKQGFCFNVFCLPCRVGGLCASLFQAADGPHFEHDRIQVFKTSYQYVVRHTEMSSHFDTRLIQWYNSNGTKCYYLRTKQTNQQAQANASTSSHNPRRSECAGCLKLFTLPRDAMTTPGLVCSVECLLQYNNSNNAQLKKVSLRRKARKQNHPTRSPTSDFMY